jgi:hypothetical protein
LKIADELDAPRFKQFCDENDLSTSFGMIGNRF